MSKKEALPLNTASRPMGCTLHWLQPLAPQYNTRLREVTDRTGSRLGPG